MKFNRTKNATRNIFFGVFQRIYQILIPFFLRTAMIYSLGVNYLGLDSLFTSILSVLNLAELGVGSAMVYSMYKPIIENDKNTICALMKLYQKYYRIIGLIILVSGLLLCPFLSYLIKDNLPSDVNLYILFLLNLLSTVFSYWLFAYKNCLLSAHQRSDISSKIIMIVNTIRYFLQFVLLLMFKNYYLYLIITLLSQILINVYTSLVVKKMYPEYLPKGNLSIDENKVINQRIKDLFTAKIGAVIVDSVDTIVISTFLGLITLGMYQNYFYLITSISSIIAVIITSCMAGIGNSILVESKNKNFHDFKTFTLIITWVTTVSACCFLTMFQSFIEIWIGKNYLLEYPIVVCLVTYFFIKQINMLLNVYKDAAGMWNKDKYRPLVTAIANLTLNLILVNYVGLYGVILSTIISMLFIGIPWILKNLFDEIFELNKFVEYFVFLVKLTIIALVCCGLCYSVSNLIDFTGFMKLIINLVVSIIVSNCSLYILLRTSKEFKRVLDICYNILRKSEFK